MATIIPFPQSADRIARDVERMLDHSSLRDDPAVKACAAKRIASVVERFPGMPTLSVSVSVPGSVPEEAFKNLTDSLQREYTEKAVAFAQKLVIEICLLEVKNCILEHQGMRRTGD